MSPNSRGLGTNMRVSADAVVVCFHKRISFRLCSGSLFGTKVSYGHLLGNAIASHTIWRHISPQHGTTHYTHPMPYDTRLHVIWTLVYTTWVSTCALRLPVHNTLRTFFDVYIELLISCGREHSVNEALGNAVMIVLFSSPVILQQPLKRTCFLRYMYVQT